MFGMPRHPDRPAPALDAASRTGAQPAEITAVILAAGRGTRLGPRCKPLVVVGGVTLLERAEATARAAGIRRIVVVVPSRNGQVATFCRAAMPELELVEASECRRGNVATVAAGLA